MNTLECIGECTRCQHHRHQRPLVDTAPSGKVDVVWLGLSAKRHDTLFARPLDDTTHSGKLISKIEQLNPNVSFYRSNALKCPPIEESKLRYPTSPELVECWPNTVIEINQLRPKFVLALGEIVAKHVSRMLGLSLVPPGPDYSVSFVFSAQLGIAAAWLPHPSFIQTYRRKDVDQFCQSISTALSQASSKEWRVL